ncbi:MAG: peptidoglycan-binding protein [Candidatus Omnitrophica bacterium]|nr:peptidoglycan-binding protein [Candidatus Omnitrophota bacterium]
MSDTFASKPSIRDMQKALRNAGFYKGEIDGNGGPLTRSAVKDFQKSHGLKVDGILGRKTWEKLEGYL